MRDLKSSKTTPLGNGRFAVDGFIGAVQMYDDGWVDIKPRLVRVNGGWYVDGAPYYAEIKDDGARVFCPDKYEKSKYFKLPSTLLVSGIKSVLLGNTKIDRELLPNRIRMHCEWGYIDYIFTNSGMKFEVFFVKSIPTSVFGESNRILFNADSNLDIASLLNVTKGLGIPRPKLIDSSEEPQKRWIEWSLKAGQLELGFDATGLKFPITLKNTTLDLEVGAGADDCYATNPDGTGWTITADYAEIGQWTAGDTKIAGTRFTGVNIAQGSTISVAYPLFYSSKALSGADCLVKCRAEDTSEPATYGTWADFDGRSWSGTESAFGPVEGWSAWAWYGDGTNYDISSTVQAIATARAITNLSLRYDQNNCDNSATRQFSQYDREVAGEVPKIHIEYSEGGAFIPPPQVLIF